MSQLLLFPQHRLPQRHLHYFHLANAGDYPAKKLHFYPFKARFLQRHALPDGFDLQTLKLRCHCGDGIFRGRDFTLPQHHWQPCNRCNGTGIWDLKRIPLHRWNLAGTIYHLPAAHLLVPSSQIRHRIDGIIQHPPVDPAAARRAALYLLALYDRPTLLAYARSQWRTLTSRARRQLNRLDQWLTDSYPEEPEFFDALHDIPF